MKQTSGLAGSLKEVEAALSDTMGRRERVLKDSRDVISSCSRAIINIHNGKAKEAEVELAKARKGLAALKKSATGPVAKYLVSPETEFVEASVVSAIVKGKAIPSKKELGSSPEAYLLGLLDAVGELKRLFLDALMDGRVKRARGYFQLMEGIYSACSPLAVYDHVANGTRRKIDVARMLVEDVRGLMAEEARREAFAKKG